MRVKAIRRADTDELYGYHFWCPACDDEHCVGVSWTFNGDLERPTFAPSILVTYGKASAGKRCHSYVRDGRIQYLSDCTHAMAGQTIELPEMQP